MTDIHKAMKQHTKGKEQEQAAPSTNGDSVRAAFNGFATAADFADSYRVASYELADGKHASKRLEFKEITPGDRFMCQGRTLNIKMTEQGLNPNDTKLKQAYIDRLTREERFEIEKEIYQRMICVAVTKPRFSMLPPERCERDLVSVWVLSESDTFGLGGAIDRFSNENDEARFRADSEPDTGSDTETRADEGGDGGSEVRSESV